TFFFFQAEDGIRDFHVTGVQTCALPIFQHVHPNLRNPTTTHCRSPAYVYSSVTRTRRSSRDEGDVSALPAVEDARPGLSAYDETGGAALVRNVTPPGFEGHPRAPARREIGRAHV